VKGNFEPKITTYAVYLNKWDKNEAEVSAKRTKHGALPNRCNLDLATI